MIAFLHAMLALYRENQQIRRAERHDSRVLAGDELLRWMRIRWN